MENARGYMPPASSTEWATPRDLFERLNAFYHFTLDPCASDENHVCDRYFTKEQDGLNQQWLSSIVFMNPPYGRAIPDWMRKAEDESKCGAVVVCLVPSRTDTRWFQRALWAATSICFLPGRLKFGGCKNPAPFPSCLISFGAPLPEEFGGLVHVNRLKS